MLLQVESSRAKTLGVLFAVSVVAVGIGLYGAMMTPAAYGLTLNRASVLMDGRPWGWTLGWILFAAVVLAVALGRASILRRQGRLSRLATIRGLVWVWGAIAGSWSLVWAAWDLQMADVLGLEANHGGVPMSGVYALSGMIALLIGLVWSVIAGSIKGRSVEVLGSERER